MIGQISTFMLWDETADVITSLPTTSVRWIWTYWFINTLPSV